MNNQAASGQTAGQTEDVDAAAEAVVGRSQRNFQRRPFPSPSQKLRLASWNAEAVARNKFGSPKTPLARSLA